VQTDFNSKRYIRLRHSLSRTGETINDSDPNIKDKLGVDNYEKISKTIDEINEIIND